MGPQFPYPPDQLYSIPGMNVLFKYGMSKGNKNLNYSTDGYMSSPERGTRAYEEPYYSQYGTRGNSVTPIIDEEQK